MGRARHLGAEAQVERAERRARLRDVAHTLRQERRRGRGVRREERAQRGLHAMQVLACGGHGRARARVARDLRHEKVLREEMAGI